MKHRQNPRTREGEGKTDHQDTFVTVQGQGQRHTPATVNSINFNFPCPTNSSSRYREDEQINDISHSEFWTGKLYILFEIYAEWEKLNWKSNIIQQQQSLELSQIVPQQEEVTNKEPAVVIIGESKMLISDLCIEKDLLEMKTQMIINLLTLTEEYGGTRKMILACASAEANTDKEQSLRENFMRKNAISLDCGTLMMDYTTNYANNDTLLLSTNIDCNFFSKKRTIDGVHEALWINPRRGVLITYFNKCVIRQIWEYQQLQEGKLLPLVDLIDCDTISISQEYHSNCGLVSADPPSMFTGTNGISCDMKCVES